MEDPDEVSCLDLRDGVAVVGGFTAARESLEGRGARYRSSDRLVAIVGIIPKRNQALVHILEVLPAPPTGANELRISIEAIGGQKVLDVVEPGLSAVILRGKIP